MVQSVDYIKTQFLANLGINNLKMLIQQILINSIPFQPRIAFKKCMLIRNGAILVEMREKCIN